jgi:hypothetical protein
MNPRKRRAIARAILAGIPKNKLNSTNIKLFLQREKSSGNLNLTEEHIQDILFPGGIVNKPTNRGTTEVRKIEEITTETPEMETPEMETPEVVSETVVENNDNQEIEYSMRNKRSELTDVLDVLNVEYKKSFSKSKLLDLINSNR